MDETDKELVALVARCALRDQDALKTLFDRLGPYLNAVAFRILKSEELSNDVLQDAFIQIWLNAASYRPDLARPLTWITSIVRYRALDRLAKERKHQVREFNDEDGGEVCSALCSADDPEQQAHMDHLQTLIATCMQRLTDNSRRSIQLAYLEGYSREEIANRLQTNVNTVKSWLHRGAERLKQCLEAKTETSI
jgi:RNA polymerase sigma-70 factor (ECF subfamily)